MNKISHSDLFFAWLLGILLGILLGSFGYEKDVVSSCKKNGASFLIYEGNLIECK